MANNMPDKSRQLAFSILTECANIGTSYIEHNSYLPNLGIQLQKIDAGLSTKRLFRATLPECSFVIAMLPIMGNCSEELFAPHFQRIASPAKAFIETAQAVSNSAGQTAEILCADEEAGVVILEDLGVTSLHDIVMTAADCTVPFRIYRDVIAWIADFQRSLSDGNHLGCQRVFDYFGLVNEMVEFRNCALWDETDTVLKRLADDLLQGIAREVAKQPLALIHRDLQSRNIMVFSGQPHIIDIQDMTMGPVVYDLVSLVYDPYVALPLEFQYELIEKFANSSARMGFAEYQSSTDFRRDIVLTAVHRNLKVAGRLMTKRNICFDSCSVEGALRNAVSLLAERPDYHELREILNLLLKLNYPGPNALRQRR